MFWLTVLIGRVRRLIAVFKRELVNISVKFIGAVSRHLIIFGPLLKGKYFDTLLN